ncbi:hypothetical protein [Streptomyces sp. NPDC002851]
MTADALHTQRHHAVFLVEAKKAHYAFTVKRNQPTLYERLRTALGAGHREVLRPRPRPRPHETRVIQVLTVDDLDFLHAAQVARVTPHSTSLKTGKRTRETICVITDLTSRQASPEKIARLVRAQWVRAQ